MYEFNILFESLMYMRMFLDMILFYIESKYGSVQKIEFELYSKQPL